MVHHHKGGEAERRSLGRVVDALCSSDLPLARTGRGSRRRRLLPSRSELIDMVEKLRVVLFPGYYSGWDLSDEGLNYYVGATLDRVLHILQGQIKRGLCLFCDQDPDNWHGCDEVAHQHTFTFLERLPDLRRLLASDVEAAFAGDPAARSYEEIIYSYPGLRAITDHRLAHELYRLDVPLIPRIISEYAHAQTGIDIHPGATIGDHFFIDHGTGVVIGETSVIGRGVRIFQGVTLGAKSFPLDEDGNPIKGIARHPVVEDEVIIYSGATILGRITLGRGSVIGGNVWLTRSIAPGSHVSQSQARSLPFEDGAGI